MTALLALVVVVLVVQAVQLRRLSDRADTVDAALWALDQLLVEIEKRAHTHPQLRRHDHEPAVGRLLDGERDASQRRGQ